VCTGKNTGKRCPRWGRRSPKKSRALGKDRDEANLPAESSSPKTEAWISRANEFARWPSDLEAPAYKGPQAARCRYAPEVAIPVRTGRFSRGDRLLKPQDFRRISRIGERAASEDFVVLMVAPEQMAGTRRPRLGMMVGRRVGNAVVRNHIKRAVREWFRQSRGRLERPVELVVIARRGAARLSAAEVSRILDEIVFSRERR
jgi:ribonuclease P protein component